VVYPEYAPHSPAYDPSEGSPEYAPYSPPYASPENIRGGKKPHYNENIYNINDEVLLRGYKYDPSILWKIIKIGNNFITIQMDERFVNRNTMEENDIIQVVSSHEIYKPDFPYYEMNYTNENMKEIPINYNQLNPTEYLPTKHTGFNFAPVIKIVNGNDNSTDEIPLKPSNISIDDTNNTPFSNMITPTIIPNDNSHINHNTIENGSDPYNGIDFSKKLIIKKI
jgi:hypothetical protein